VAPFVGNPGVTPVPLLDGRGVSGYARVGRWAVTPGDVLAPAGLREEALTEYLAILAERGLRPAFLAAGEPEPYRARGMHVVEVADEATVALDEFGLSGPRRANLRHSTTSARRIGLTVARYASWHEPQIAEISDEWLRTKRGGELGFTLSRHEDVTQQLADGTADLWLTIDGEGIVQAWCTWRPYLDGNARVLDVMRRRVHAPNPAMDALLVTVLENYRDAGLVQASLASVPRSHGELAERVFPARSLRAYKEKFAPQWSPRWLAVPARHHELLALAAVGKAYCPGGLRRALFRNR
jgi:phosphatidylglycerol lysyltransferase